MYYWDSVARPETMWPCPSMTVMILILLLCLNLTSTECSSQDYKVKFSKQIKMLISFSVQISGDGQHCISSIRNCVGVVPFLEEEEDCRRQCESLSQCRHYQYDPGTTSLSVFITATPSQNVLKDGDGQDGLTIFYTNQPQQPYLLIWALL